MASFAEELGSPVEALPLAERAVRLGTGNVAGLIHAARLCELACKWDSAIEHYRQAITLHPHSAPLWSRLGHSCVMINDHRTAYQAFLRALQLDSRLPDPLLFAGFGFIYQWAKLWDYAAEFFRHALRLSPPPLLANEVHFRLAVLAIKTGKYADAVAELQACSPMGTIRKVDIVVQLAFVADAQGDMNTAAHHYLEAVRIDPSSPPALMGLAWLLHRSGSHVASARIMALLERASLLGRPRASMAHYVMGRHKIALRDFHGSFTAYQAALHSDRYLSVYWCSVGTMYFTLGQHAEALESFMKGVADDRSLPELWFNMGTLYHACHQFQDAREAYREARTLDPRNPQFLARFETSCDVAPPRPDPPPVGAIAGAAATPAEAVVRSPLLAAVAVGGGLPFVPPPPPVAPPPSSAPLVVPALPGAQPAGGGSDGGGDAETAGDADPAGSEGAAAAAVEDANDGDADDGAGGGSESEGSASASGDGGGSGAADAGGSSSGDDDSAGSGDVDGGDAADFSAAPLPGAAEAPPALAPLRLGVVDAEQPPDGGEERGGGDDADPADAPTPCGGDDGRVGGVKRYRDGARDDGGASRVDVGDGGGRGGAVAVADEVGGGDFGSASDGGGARSAKRLRLAAGTQP